MGSTPSLLGLVTREAEMHHGLVALGVEAERSEETSPPDSRNSVLFAEMCSGAGLWKRQAERKLEPSREQCLLQGQEWFATFVRAPEGAALSALQSAQAMAARILDPAWSRALRAEPRPPGLGMGWDGGDPAGMSRPKAGSVSGCPERALDLSSICSLPGLARA